jgi:ferredoxin-thioredoxin reductase catalytic chain
MKMGATGNTERTDEVYEKLLADGEATGYHLNPDRQFTRELIGGLIANEERYGYRSCPCRLASGDKEDDLDIICPCDYRDSDLGECGTCFCSLYVSEKVVKGTQVPCSIPERRPVRASGKKTRQGPSGELPSQALSHPVWRCSVCGYLCARGEPPELCPVCKAQKERFERFM